MRTGTKLGLLLVVAAGLVWFEVDATDARRTGRVPMALLLGCVVPFVLLAFPRFRCGTRGPWGAVLVAPLVALPLGALYAALTRAEGLARIEPAASGAAHAAVPALLLALAYALVSAVLPSGPAQRTAADFEEGLDDGL